MKKGFAFVFDALAAIIVASVLITAITSMNPKQNESNALLASQPTALDAATVKIHKTSLNQSVLTEAQISTDDGNLMSCEETIKYNGSNSSEIICRVIN
ncbi:MAG: hypothetical protein JW703_03535 [Candidatus Diapherotrites archaeon]|nr:hypothetical protein [Candidatus Diapherotrites archaeon]